MSKWTEYQIRTIGYIHLKVLAMRRLIRKTFSERKQTSAGVELLHKILSYKKFILLLLTLLNYLKLCLLRIVKSWVALPLLFIVITLNDYLLLAGKWNSCLVRQMIHTWLEIFLRGFQVVKLPSSYILSKWMMPFQCRWRQGN